MQSAHVVTVLVVCLVATPATLAAQQQAGSTARASDTADAPAWRTIVDDVRVLITLDSTRVARLPDRRLALWTRWQWRDEQPTSRLLASEWTESLDHWLVDCERRLFSERETRLFDAGGRQVSRTVAPASDSSWYELLPKSYGNAVVSSACGRYAAEPRAKPARRRARRAP